MPVEQHNPDILDLVDMSQFEQDNPSSHTL